MFLIERLCGLLRCFVSSEANQAKRRHRRTNHEVVDRDSQGGPEAFGPQQARAEGVCVWCVVHQRLEGPAPRDEHRCDGELHVCHLHVARLAQLRGTDLERVHRVVGGPDECGGGRQPNLHLLPAGSALIGPAGHAQGRVASVAVLGRQRPSRFGGRGTTKLKVIIYEQIIRFPRPNRFR